MTNRHTETHTHGHTETQYTCAIVISSVIAELKQEATLHTAQLKDMFLQVFEDNLFLTWLEIVHLQDCILIVLQNVISSV